MDKRPAPRLLSGAVSSERTLAPCCDGPVVRSVRFRGNVCCGKLRHDVWKTEEGATLNELIATPRISRDVDLFHDSEEALAATWDADRRLLEVSRFSVTVLRERPVFVEARVAQGDESVLLQWVRDSAYRFFPLVEHEELGLVLHPFGPCDKQGPCSGGSSGSP